MVEAPCTCGASLRFGQTTCARCGTKVGPGLRDELERRAQAGYPAYGEARQDTERAGIFVLALALLYCTIGVFVYAFSGADYIVEDDDARFLRLANFAFDAIVGVVLLACHLVARRRPTVGLPAALIFYVGVQIVLIARAPHIAFAGAAALAISFAKLAFVILLARGVLASRRLARERTRIVREP